MSDDAETIVQLQAERAELLLRIDAAVAEGRRAQRRDDAASIGPPVWAHEEFTAAVEAEREECAAVVDAWHEELSRSHVVPGREASARYALHLLRNVAADIRARGGSR